VDKQDIKLSSVIQLYLMYQEDCNHSPKTVRWYSDMLRRFSEWLGPDAQIKDIKNDAIRDYLRSIRERGFSKFTNHAYARTLKTFIRWMGREGYVGEMAYSAVEMPKVPKYEDVIVEVLTDEEIAHLLGLLNIDTDIGCRDRAIVCLMLESGFRLAEVTNLQVDDLHLKELYVKDKRQGRQGSLRPDRSDHPEGTQPLHDRVPRAGEPDDKDVVGRQNLIRYDGIGDHDCRRWPPGTAMGVKVW
jgi:site-specific recombinase XerD